MIYSCGICGLVIPNGLGSHSASDCALGLKRENERLRAVVEEMKRAIDKYAPHAWDQFQKCLARVADILNNETKGKTNGTES